MRAEHAARGVVPGIAAAAVGLLVMAAFAALAADVETRATYGFDGVARPERWSPVTVELTNRGPEREGLLVLAPGERRFAQAYQRRVASVRLPQGSRQRHTLFWYDPSGFGVTPVAIFAGRASHEPGVTYVREEQSLLVATGFPPGALGYLSQVERTRLSSGPAHSGGPYGPYGGGSQPAIKGNIVPAHISPGRLPENPLAYCQVDLLVLGPVFASDLSPGPHGAQAAITSWVRTGGNLVITGGADAARLGDPFFQALLPVEGLTASDTTISSGLSAYALSIPESVPVVAGVPKPGARVLAQEGGVPLVVRGRVGSGTVTFLAFDPTQPPVAAAAALEKLWLSFFDDRARLYSLQEVSQVRGMFYDGVTSIKEMRAPSLLMVAGFLGLYFLLLIPANHWVLARRRRRELAWVTTPIIVAAFFIGAYAFGYSIKGPRLLVNQRTLMEAGEGSPVALALSNFGVFSPARRAYDIRVGLDQALVTEVSYEDWGNPYGYGRRGPQPSAGLVHDELEPWVERAQIAMWGMRVYGAEGVVDMGGPVRSDIRMERTRLVGWIENDTKWTLKTPTLVAPGAHTGLPLQDIEPGKRTEFDIVVDLTSSAAPSGMSALTAIGSSPGQRRRLRLRADEATAATRKLASPQAPRRRLQGMEERAVSALMSPKRLVSQLGLLCHVAPSPIPIDVGRECDYSDQTLLLVHLPLQTASRQVRLPAGSYVATSDTGLPGGGLQAYLASDRDVIYTFEPPPDLAGIRVDGLEVICNLAGDAHGPPLCDVSLYDRSGGAWEKVGAAPAADGGAQAPRAGRWGGVQQTIVVPEPGRFVAEDGTIKVRLVRREDVPGVQVHRVDIIVSGER
ncbi:MAG: hypothetical protein JSV65_18550 [Armatimonadota bacterium]|nr:MAG: hypothetical protein JSV65_18550 [Armatimonadota bacterium]